MNRNPQPRLQPTTGEKTTRFSASGAGFHWQTGTVPDLRLASSARPPLSLGRAFLVAAIGVLAAFLLLAWVGTTRSQAAVTCPSAIPVVNENQCKGAGSEGYETNEDSPNLGGYPTQTSVNLGESITLKIGYKGAVSPSRTAAISVYRMGYYEGQGGRLVNSASNVAVNNDFTCEAMNETTGEVSCANWKATYTIPGTAFPASGVYMAKVKASTGDETQIVFTVRNDNSHSRILYVLPMATYEAYNTFGGTWNGEEGGKSLYYGTRGYGTGPVTGSSRAAKVSFDRPLGQAGVEQNWFAGPDQELLYWMEKQGYDISYTDDISIQQNPEQLLNHDTVVISGHSEYWSVNEFKAFLAAREAGVNIASFSSNTAYWKVRYENNGHTLVCYKTVEGSGSAGSGAVSQNDWGPDGIKGTADDALGPDGIAGTADDNPMNATTTWRDNGAPNGDPSAPAGGRVGPDMPENELFGIMYVGDNDSENFPITIPAANAAGEFAGSPVWRNTGISKNSSTTINEPMVGWEWDTIPTQAQYLKYEPEGVERIFSTNVQTVNDNSWIQDEGRLRNTAPPPGQPGTIGAVRYKAKSGAEVFASGTMYWARGLTGYADERIQQATYNILSEMGESPNTPEEGITLDPGGSNHAPSSSFTVSQNPAKTATAITFDASASKDSDGSIAKYEWDLDGDGTFETTTSTPKVTHSYAAEGTYSVRLRVTDNGGATDLSAQTLTIINNQPPTASFTVNPESAIKNEAIAFNGAASSDPDGTISKYEWDFNGDGTYETSSASSPTISHTYPTPGNYTVGLRVTDNGGKTATTTRPVTVGSGEPSHYSTSVLATPGLAHYWRLGETAGPTFSDSKGSSPATATGGVTFGAPGAIAEDTDHSAKFDGATGAAQAPVNLAATHTATVEFWLNWEAFNNDDKLALELTNNFNENAGGFLVDPDAPQLGGTFGVAIGSNASRNNIFFERPSAGAWHYYAFVMNTAKPAAEQIIPYVDGKPVSYQKIDNGTGAGNFANSILSFMSRAASSNFGGGSLDELAVYERALSASTIAKHYIGEMVEGTEGSEGSTGGETGGGGTGGGEEGPPLGGTGASYTDSVLATPGIADYWPMSEAAGPTIADTVGSNPLSATGEPAFGAAGGVPGETASSVKFDGVNDAATGPIHLGGQTAVTVEFWMKWNAWANNDELAMEYTPNFNDNPGGFLVDPNSSYGKFAVSIGIGASRNVDLFERPSAGVWHHYAFVLNSAAPATEQIVPYVDGFPVVYTKAASGEGGPAFAESTLSLMSRGGKELFGAGNLQDVAIFTRALNAATVSQQYASNGPNGRPQATFIAPTTAKVGEKLTFDASGSKDPDGTIAKYEWDLDGNGSYETDTGTTPSVSTTYTGDGKVAVGLRVTDNAGNTGTATRTVTVEEPTSGGGGESGAADYSGSVLGTPGLVDYWPLKETSGSVFADAAGTSPATMLGGPTLGVTGGAPGDTGTAARFDGVDDAAGASLQLGGQTAVTVEFWMKWNEWKNEDQLAFEYTPNFNDNDGGFLIDPNSSYGSFAVALGRGASRNVALFARPTAGAWHHYALVLDTSAPASEEIVPFVDGKPVAYTKAAEGTGAGAFANSTLYFMSRGGTALNGAGDLQDVAVYDRPLSAAQVASHFAGVKTNQPPTASFTAPASVKVGETVTLDASASKDADGAVEQYEWDLDGDGTFETSTGSNPKVTRSFGTSGQVQVSLRVTDNAGASSVTSHTLTVQPSEGGGEEGGGTGSGSGAAYRSAVAATPGLEHFWSLGEKSGSVLTDSVGGATATTLGEPALGVPGAIAGDTDSAVGFDGINDAASAPLTLSGHSAITLEFWMKWNEWSNNDQLAFEYTSNFNDNPGGFLVDPNSSFGSFAVGLGQGESRNVSTFARPSAGVWHHYAFVLNTSAPASEEIVPFVDGQPVAYSKVASGTGAGNFADATLSFMSRAGTSLNGAGSLDDVSIYGAPLSAATIAAHYEAATPNKAPTASFTASPNPANTNATVTFNAAASKDLDGTITKYEWDLDGNGSYETNTGTTPTASTTYATPGERAVHLRVTDDRGATATATSTVTVRNQPPTASFTASPSTAPTGSAIALDASGSSDPDGAIASYEWDLDGNGTYETTTGTTPTASASFATPGSRAIGLRVTDNGGATATTTRTVTIQNRAPLASFTASPNPATAGQVVAFNAAGSSDPDGTITKYEWDLDGNGTFETSTGTTPTASTTYATSGERTVGLRVTDNAGATTTVTKAVTIANQPPTASFTATPTSAPTGTSVAFNAGASKDPDGTIAKYEWDLDGNGSYETNSGTAPTASTTYATPGARTVGLRVTDNSGTTATTTVPVTATNRAPTASFTATPNPVPTGTSVSFNAGASKDPDGTIAKYEWDLDGNGTYEMNTGTTPSAISNYATAGTRNVGLRVTDNSGATATTTVGVTVQNRPPVASFTATPNPVTAGTTVNFSAAGSSDPDGTITKYEWDLDGNGSYETSTGTTNKTSRNYTTAATTNVGLRVTDNAGATSTTTVPVTIRSPYNAAVLGTAGLVDYWRLGETSGTTFADSVGGANATAFNGVSLNQSHPLTDDTNPAASFDGTNDYATAPVNLSGTSKLTIEFWLKWNSILYTSNNDQVLELTNNFNNTNGGFLVNPASSTSGSRFEVAIGRGTSRNNVYFTRPSVLAWHHYAFVINTTAAAAQQILAYVDGKAVTVTKGSSGTGAGNFANSTLYFMSRGGTTQFAPATLDEVAIYNTALTSTQIAAHYAAR
jgi:YD repeat-containing protein